MSFTNDDLATCIEQASSQDTADAIESALAGLGRTNTEDARKIAAKIAADRDLIEMFARKQFERGALWMMENLR